MNAADSTLTYVDAEALKRLAQGLTFDLPRCAQVLDGALISLNEQTGLPDRMLAWIRAGGLMSGTGPVERRGRIIVDITQTMNADRQQGYFATVLCKSDERESAPVAFFSMHSPTLDVPMRVEVPLRALMVGNPPLAGSYTLYVHALMTSLGETYVYYGITKRGWSIRFNEHTRAAVAQRSKRLLARKLDELIDARAAELSGRGDDRAKLAGIISAVCGTGMSREAALAAEERMVDKYSLASKHPYGLNMIPGGLAGLSHIRNFLRDR
ncbi:hypothetical protein [Rhodopseudomonas sp. AAP120]|uniref:hypothetical protein n=1 Tax=Rhodopseudomonas sp. AAP120 TaxID=1523430 RepID=UPI000A618738|nr:hypothetical protein [Rhodopseudomonas sp. AAP120]